MRYARVKRRLPLIEINDHPNLVQVESDIPKETRVIGLLGSVESRNVSLRSNGEDFTWTFWSIWRCHVGVMLKR